MGIIIVLAIIGAAIWAGAHQWSRAQLRKAERETFMLAHRGWAMFVSPIDDGVIAINRSEQRIALGTASEHAELPWSKISSVEIERNGETITTTNRGPQLFGAAVGAALLGPAGLLLGGLTGPKRTRNRIRELSLKIVVDDPHRPVHRLVFLRLKGDGIAADSRALREPVSRLEHFHALVSNAIRSASQQHYGAPAAAGTGALEGRIAKLWELHQAGALSPEEFQQAKLNLISETPRIAPA